MSTECPWRSWSARIMVDLPVPLPPCRQYRPGPSNSILNDPAIGPPLTISKTFSSAGGSVSFCIGKNLLFRSFTTTCVNPFPGLVGIRFQFRVASITEHIVRPHNAVQHLL